MPWFGGALTLVEEKNESSRVFICQGILHLRSDLCNYTVNTYEVYCKSLDTIIIIS